MPSLPARQASVMALLSWAVVLLLVGCGGGEDDNGMLGGDKPPRGACVFNTFTQSCTCNLDFVGNTLVADEIAVDDCDSPPAGVDWDCCYDLDTLGASTFCACAASNCFQRRDSDHCTCGYQDRGEVDGQIGSALLDIVESCSSTQCCRSGTECSCYSTQFVCALPEPVDQCTPPTAPRDCSGFGGRRAESCAGLTWAR